MTARDHRVPIGDEWWLWEDGELRGAGFPIDIVQAAATPALAEAIDQDRASDELFQAEWLGSAERLHAIAREPRFREALIWQNRRAFHSGIASLLHKPARFNAQARRNELLLASYVQRYGAKNETIGFFGASSPVLVDPASAHTIEAAGDAAGIAQRRIFLEPWAIDALAHRLARDPELRRELVPRWMPTMRLEQTTLHHPIDRVDELPADYARVLAACDGKTPAHAIATALSATEDEVFAMLDELVEKRLVTWAIEVPTKGGAPEQLLRAELAKLAPTPAVARAIAMLQELEQERDTVARAAGSPDDLDAALARLDDTFARLTGVEGVRLEGSTYAGRTLAGEDCVRDFTMTLGAPFLERVRGPLELVLASARWFTYTIAEHYREALHDVHAQLGGGTVDYQRFAEAIKPLFPGAHDPASIVARVTAQLRARWREILRFEGPERVVERTVAECAPAVAAAFAAPHPGWPAARHHAPDVLIASPSVAAAASGDFVIVLGELHVGMNTLLVPSVAHRHADPDALWKLRDREITTPAVAPVWSHKRTRVDLYSRAPGDFDVENGAARSWRSADHVIAVADLIVVERDGRLRVQARDARHDFDIIDFLEQHLIAEAHGAFGMVGVDNHRPRIVLGGVVIARESWTFPASELEFANAATPIERFTKARAWMRAAGLPRHGFVRVAEEVKPYYVDFASPLFVETLSRVGRKTTRLGFTEMLPSADQLWLVDAAGHRYTSELRIVAVDSRAAT